MLSINIATKGRPNSLLRCVNSIPDYADIHIYACDNEDVPKEIINRNKIIVFFDKDITVIAAQNEMAKWSIGHILPTSDDVEFMPGAIDIAYSLVLHHGGDIVVGFRTENMKSNDDAFVMVGRKFYEQHGLYHDGYRHFYADTELGDKAKRLNKFIYCNEALLKHYHPAVTGVSDATHNFQRNEKLIHDEQVYNSRILHRQL